MEVMKHQYGFLRGRRQQAVPDPNDEDMEDSNHEE